MRHLRNLDGHRFVVEAACAIEPRRARSHLGTAFQRRRNVIEELCQTIHVHTLILEITQLAGMIEERASSGGCCNRVTGLLNRHHSLAYRLLSGNPFRPLSTTMKSGIGCSCAGMESSSEDFSRPGLDGNFRQCHSSARLPYNLGELTGILDHDFRLA